MTMMGGWTTLAAATPDVDAVLTKVRSALFCCCYACLVCVSSSGALASSCPMSQVVSQLQQTWFPTSGFNTFTAINFISLLVAGMNYKIRV